MNTITTPKLLEYTTKAVMLAASYADCDYDRDHISMKLIGAGRLTFTLPVRWSTTSIWVNIGDFEKYEEFVSKMLSKLNKYTGKPTLLTTLTSTEMNLPYIQSEIFRELVGMETQLKPEYAITIVRERDKNLMYVEVEYSSERVHPLGSPRILYKTHIFARSLKTQSDITAEINRIWQAIPAKCKKDNILK